MDVKRRGLTIACRANGVLRPGDNQIIGVQPKHDVAILAHAIDGDEGRIFHRDCQLFERRDQPVLPLFVAAHQPGKGAHHRWAGNLAPVMEPAAIGGDPHQAVPACLRCPRLNRGQLALLHLFGNLGQR